MKRGKHIFCAFHSRIFWQRKQAFTQTVQNEATRWKLAFLCFSILSFPKTLTTTKSDCWISCTNYAFTFCSTFFKHASRQTLGLKAGVPEVFFLDKFWSQNPKLNWQFSNNLFALRVFNFLFLPLCKNVTMIWRLVAAKKQLNSLWPNSNAVAQAHDWSLLRKLEIANEQLWWKMVFGRMAKKFYFLSWQDLKYADFH